MAKETKVIEINVNAATAIDQIAQLQREIDNLTLSQKNNKKETDIQRQAYASNTAQLREYRKQLNSLVVETANEMRAGAQKLGYLQQLEASVSNLEKAYYRLSKAELEGTKGTTILKNLKEQRAELQTAQAAYGKYSMNVGNYASATNMLAINLGQVMKEIPNFAISARIGIMSLTNNLPMLAEAFKAVRVQQQQMIAEGKAVPSMFSLITKSVFGLTGIMSIAMVLLQLFSEDIINWVSGIIKANKPINELKENQKLFNEILKTGSSEMENSFKKVKDVEIAFSQYKSGILTAKEALTIFNKQLGEQLGKHEDINAAMTTFESKADKWIELQYKMALVNAYSEKAANAYVEANFAKQKSDEQYIKWYDSRIFQFVQKTEGQMQQLAENRREKAVKKQMSFVEMWSKFQKEAQDDVLLFAEKWGLKIKDMTNQNNNLMLSYFDYQSKMAEANAKSLEQGREKEIALAEADYLKKLNLSEKHISKLIEQEKKGVKGATEALAIARKKHAEYEIALTEEKERKIRDIEVKYTNLRINNAIERLANSYSMVQALGGKSAKETYETALKYMNAEYDLKKVAIENENISEEEKILKLKLLDEKFLADKKVAYENYRESELLENQKIIQHEIESLDKKYGSELKYIDFIANKKRALLKSQMDEEIKQAGNNESLIYAIRQKYAKLNIDLDNEVFNQKANYLIKYVDYGMELLSSLNDYFNSISEAELQNYAQTIAGKANYDELYAQKKYELEHETAKRQKALGIFSTLIDTAKGIISVWGDSTLPTTAKIILSAIAGATGLAQTAAVAAQPLPVPPTASTGSKISGTSTVKFHTGGVAGSTPDSPNREQEITRTLLTTERVLSPQQTSIFDSLVAKVSAMGGSNAIVSGAAQVTSDVDRMYVAMSKALRDMPAPIMTWQEFERQQDRQRRLKNNAIIK